MDKETLAKNPACCRLRVKCLAQNLPATINIPIHGKDWLLAIEWDFNYTPTIPSKVKFYRKTIEQLEDATTVHKENSNFEFPDSSRNGSLSMAHNAWRKTSHVEVGQTSGKNDKRTSTTITECFNKFFELKRQKGQNVVLVGQKETEAAVSFRQKPCQNLITNCYKKKSISPDKETEVIVSTDSEHVIHDFNPFIQTEMSVLENEQLSHSLNREIVQINSIYNTVDLIMDATTNLGGNFGDTADMIRAMYTEIVVKHLKLRKRRGNNKIPSMDEIISVQDTIEEYGTDKEEEMEVYQDAVNLASNGLNGLNGY